MYYFIKVTAQHCIYVTVTLPTQDAHECWSALVNALADRLPICHGDPSQVSATPTVTKVMALLLATTCHTKTKFYGSVFWGSLRNNVSLVILMYVILNLCLVLNVMRTPMNQLLRILRGSTN